MEDPLACRDGAAVHVHPTLPSRPGPTLGGHQVVPMGHPSTKRLLAAARMVNAGHRAPLPLDGMRRLIPPGAGHRHLGAARTADQPAFLSWNQRRTRSPLTTPVLCGTSSATWRSR
jgi:hypothetical protein